MRHLRLVTMTHQDGTPYTPNEPLTDVGTCLIEAIPVEVLSALEVMGHAIRIPRSVPRDRALAACDTVAEWLHPDQPRSS